MIFANEEQISPGRLLPTTMRTLLLCLLASPLLAADWSTYRGDAARSGYSAETIPIELRQRWEFRLPSPPRPAWPTSERMEYDLAFQPIIVGDLVLFGSSADDQVYALDAMTGRIRWRFFTGGPVRFAPAAWKDRVFVASDDGHLYALALADGKMLWKHHAGPGAQRVMGNERMISHWPARGGPVVWEDKVYYSGGIWPSDGVFLYSLDAATGTPVWQNSESGGLFMAQPHSGAEAVSGVAPQGYLLATDTSLIVPTGRAVPAVFELGDGKLRYYHLQKNQQRGGSRVLVSETSFINSGCLFDVATGDLTTQLGMGSAVAIPGGVVRAEGRSLATYRWKDVEKIDRKGATTKSRSLVQDKIAPIDKEVLEFIITGSEAVVGCDGQISAIDYNGQRTQWWKQSVEGRVLGLAAGNGRVVATTDKGVVYLFDGDPSPLPAPAPIAEEKPLDAAVMAEAKSILDAAKINEGYALVLGSGHADFALALARHSDLHVIALESDEAIADAARHRAANAAVYGTRVAVHVGALDVTNYPKQFADLVIAPKQVTPAIQKEMERLRRPYSGLICHRDGLKIEKASAPAGAGSWTHQNGSAANTLCSDDEIVKGKLSMFWFRDVEFEVANRHGNGPAPLVSQGYMVTSGVNGLCCLDAYNGRRLWDFDVKNFLIDYDGIHHDVGIGDTGGPFCIGGDSVYVKSGPRCLRIDLATGKLVREFATPVAADATNRNWGYLAFENGLLFGSVENAAHNVSPRYALTNLRTESVLLFAMDPATGATKWKYEPKGSIRHNSVAIAGVRVYLIDRPIIEADRVENPKRTGKAAPKLAHSDVPSGTLLALEAATGKVIWENKEDIWGTQVAVSAKQGVLLMNYKAVRHNFFELPSEVGGRLAGFDIATGKRLWDQDAKYQTRPLINDTTIYAQGGAWDLKSGSPVAWDLQRSYGCGQISASKNLMLFRSATLGYVDLTRDAGTENYGGIRPSCWINAIPASGLVLVPDGSSKCHCSYQMKAWFALQGEE
jgi:outer membrane protein assembly factor BamB